MDPASAQLAPVLDAATTATYALSIGAIVVELIVLKARRFPLDHAGGRVSVVSGLLAFGLLAIGQRLLVFGAMDLAWAWRVVDAGVGPWAWLAAFVAYDFMFYVAHRLGHEVRLLWCFHIAHHTTDEMRLTSAIRGSAFDVLYLPWFFAWLPLLGLHPSLVLIAEAFGRLWGVAVHVSPHLIGKLGPLDRWMVTPSFHRVHHGKDEAYLDRNYGEVLSVWDHLFRTWTPETEPPTYGVRQPLDPRSLYDVQLQPWADLWRDLRAAPGWGARLRTLFDAPGWYPDGRDERVRARRRADPA